MQKIMINPEIIKKSVKKLNPEGCLSVPGFEEEVERYNKVTCVYTDAEGNEMDLIQCKSGDAYFQGANTLHGFRNGSEVTELIYIENKRPR